MPAAPRTIPDLLAKMCDFSQLDAAALGRIRKTSEDPPRISVYDLIGCITGQTQSDSRNVWERLLNACPDCSTICSPFTFGGRGGYQETPVVDARAEQSRSSCSFQAEPPRSSARKRHL